MNARDRHLVGRQGGDERKRPAGLRTVTVPDEFAPLFEAAQTYVSRYFEGQKAEPEKGTISIHLGVSEGRAMRQVLDSLMVEGRTVHNLSTHDPSLEDVFVAIVGRGLNEDVGGDA